MADTRLTTGEYLVRLLESYGVDLIFGIPGVGRISINAIQARDMPLLQGSVLFATALVILGNLVADILYSVLDPRIRHQMKGGVK